MKDIATIAGYMHVHKNTEPLGTMVYIILTRTLLRPANELSTVRGTIRSCLNKLNAKGVTWKMPMMYCPDFLRLFVSMVGLSFRYRAVLTVSSSQLPKLMPKFVTFFRLRNT